MWPDSTNTRLRERRRHFKQLMVVDLDNYLRKYYWIFKQIVSFITGIVFFQRFKQNFIVFYYFYLLAIHLRHLFSLLRYYLLLLLTFSRKTTPLIAIRVVIKTVEKLIGPGVARGLKKYIQKNQFSKEKNRIFGEKKSRLF